MRMLSLQKNYGIFWLLVVLLGGCSSYHNVSIMSHGDEMAGEAKDSSPPPSPVVSLPSVPEIELEASDPVVPQSLKPQTDPSPKGSAIAAQSAEDADLPRVLEDVFFDYDHYSIRREDIPSLKLNARVLLKRFPTREVLIQGHCDERGTEEYNLILGERRAMMVKNYLVDLGVPASNLRVLSLGKNKPFCHEPTLPCFQQNRRAHFVLE